MKRIRKLTLQELKAKLGTRHVSGAVHFTDDSFVTFINASVSQIISYINTNEKEFKYFATI